MSISLRMHATIAAATLATTLPLLAAPAANANAAGQLCRTSWDAVTAVLPRASYGYRLAPGSLFRIEGFAPGLYIGHGTNLPQGYIARTAIIPGSCR